MSNQLPEDIVIAMRRLTQALGDPRQMWVRVGDSVEATMIKDAAERLLKINTVTVQQLSRAFEAWENEFRDDPSSFLTPEECAALEVATLSDQRAIYLAAILRRQGASGSLIREVVREVITEPLQQIVNKVQPDAYNRRLRQQLEQEWSGLEQLKQSAPQTREQWLAVREGHHNAAAEEYFSARPHLDTPDIRRVFYAGHCKGYDAASEAPATAVVQAPTLDRIMAVAKAIHRTEPDPDLPDWDELRQHDIDVLRARADAVIRVAAPEAPAAATTQDRDALARAMADKLMVWKLPENFGPDCFITFDRDMAAKNPHCWPVGTNLFTHEQAVQMLLDIMPAAPEAPVQECGLCGADEPFTGSCGGGRENPRALCFAAPEAPAQGEVVVTWNHDRTGIVAVTRQNAEGQVLKVIAQAPAQGKETPYYISGPYTTGEHAGQYGVAEVNTGRIVHFFKPCDFPTCAPHHPCTKPCFRNSGEKSK